MTIGGRKWKIRYSHGNNGIKKSYNPKEHDSHKETRCNEWKEKETKQVECDNKKIIIIT